VNGEVQIEVVILSFDVGFWLVDGCEERWLEWLLHAEEGLRLFNQRGSTVEGPEFKQAMSSTIDLDV
jgi:hypothetical protein